MCKLNWGVKQTQATATTLLNTELQHCVLQHFQHPATSSSTAQTAATTAATAALLLLLLEEQTMMVDAWHQYCNCCVQCRSEAVSTARWPPGAAMQCKRLKLTRILLTLLFHAMQAGRAAPEHRRNAETL